MPKLKIASRLVALASVILISLSACGGGGGTADVPPVQASSGTVSGRIADAETGEPIAGVDVKVGAITATSDAAGKYALAGVPAGAGVVAQFSKPQYAASFATVDVANARVSVADRRLAKVGVTKELSAAAGGVVGLPGSAAQVQLPAGGFVNAASGAVYNGSVVVSMTPIDPRASPQAMPGNYRAQGEAVPIESMGALQVEMRDSAGALLNLAPGKSATIRIPVPGGVLSPPLSMPLYYFKEATGLWVREGAATLQGNPPQQYYEGTVSHFTWWNADQPLDTIYINGCVVNAAGQPIDATVSTSGIDYIGESRLVTQPGGLFRLPVRRNSDVLVAAQNGDDLASITVKTGSADMTLPACLVISQDPPVIVTQPASLTIAPGRFTSLFVGANNATQYRWYRNGVLVGTGSSSLWLFSDAGGYNVVVSNAHGSVTSQTVTVTVAEPVAAPLIVAQPESVSIVAGSSATFRVLVQGDSLSYQWLRNGVDIVGARGPVLTMPAVNVGEDSNNYSVRVSNGAGTVTSTPARLNVSSTAVAAGIYEQPASTSVAPGQRATFAVKASGTGPFTYQWMLNGAAIANATAASYQTPATTAADNGAAYTVRVSNEKGNILSNVAALAVIADSRVAGLYLSFVHGAAVNGEFSYGAIAQAGGAAVSFLPAGEGTVTEMLVQGQMSNNIVSNLHIHSFLYWKNDKLFRRDLVGANGLPAEVQVSAVSGAGVCNKGMDLSSDAAGSGADLADMAKSWKIVRKQGDDGLCNTDDDRFFAVRVNMAPADAPLEVPRPVASIHSAQGALTGWLVRNGQQMQRANADFSSPVTLFTLPADDLVFEVDAGLDNTWVFTSGGTVYTVDLGGAAPAILTPIAKLAADETVSGSSYVVDKSIYVTMSTLSSTRIVRFATDTRTVIAVGSVPGTSSIVTVTPTRVIMYGALGNLVALPIGGGAAQPVYVPPTPRFSFNVQRGGERLWQDMQDSVVSVNADGSGVQVLPGAKLAGCLYRAQLDVNADPRMCDAVLVVDGTAVRSYDAQSGALRQTYGNVTLPAAPLSSMFSAGYLPAWGQPIVLSQFIMNPADGKQQAVVNYFINTAQPGITPIAF